MKRSRTLCVSAGMVLACGMLQAAAVAAAGAGHGQSEAATATRTKKVTHSDTHKSTIAVSQLPRVPRIEARTNLVLVDVVVTHRGRHVKGLRKSQFRVFDDGKPQKITVFEEHGKARKSAAGHRAALRRLPPGVYSNRPVLPQNGAADVLLLDALNTPVSAQMYVRKQMVALLGKLPQGAHLAIFTLGSRLRMVQGFDANTAALAAAMRGRRMVRASPVLRPEYAGPMEHEAQQTIELGATQTGVQALRQFEADQKSMRTGLRVKITLHALDELANYLRLVPGRKNLIWVSGSFPFAIYRDETLPAPLEPERNYAARIAWTAALMSSARVAVYPVDARGMTQLPSTSAMESSSDDTSVLDNNPLQVFNQQGGRARNGMNLTASTTGGVQPGTFGEPSMARANWRFLRSMDRERASMQALAHNTGGRVFANTNDIGKAVKEALAAGANYYTIGYVPHLRRHDESFHRLKVKLAHGYHADYRSGYYADTTAVNPHPQHAQMAAAVLDNGPPVSGLVFDVRMRPAGHRHGAPKKAGHGQAWNIDYAVPVRQVDFEPGAGGVRRARLELVAVAYSANGKNLKFADERAEVRLPANVYARVKQKAMPIRQKMEVPTGTAQVRVVVHDLQSGKIGATEIPVVRGRRGHGESRAK